MKSFIFRNLGRISTFYNLRDRGAWDNKTENKSMIRKKIVYNKIDDFSVWLRTGSYPADINPCRRRTQNMIIVEFV